tara:strand:+ start:465 stop:608 length:144 start_codon:yes stop_codon:yes gene_type:complete
MFKWIQKRISKPDDSGKLAKVFPARNYIGICNCDDAVRSTGVYGKRF